MRTTRALLAELGGVSIAIVAAVVGVFVVVAAQLVFHGWGGSIPDEVHHFDADKPVAIAPGPNARRLAAGAAAGTGAASPTITATGSQTGGGGVTLSGGNSRQSGPGGDRPTNAATAPASSAGHAHHPQPPATSAPAAPSVTTDVVDTVDGSVGRTKQKTGNGADRTESAAPVESPAAPAVADTDAPSTNPVPTSPAPRRAEARGGRPSAAGLS